MKFHFPPDHIEFIEKEIHSRDVILAMDPDNIEAKYNKALMLLSIGRFEEGWPLFECRLEVKDSVFTYDWFPVPRWDGKDIAGKHVLMWLEQGIGDQVMAAATLGQLSEKAASVVLMADRRLAPLFRRSFPKIEFFAVGEPLPERLKTWHFDCQLSMSDLGQMFRRSFETFNAKPYLKPDPEKVKRLREKYLNGKSGKLIGFSWVSANNKASMVKSTYGALKSIPPKQFAKALDMRGNTYVSLQYGDHETDLQAFRDLGVNVVVDPDIDPLLSLDDCAAQIAAMDHVVSVSNSTVHIAGSMGIPTSALVPVGHGRVWYWHTAMDKSAWYPCVRIHRSHVPGEWDQAISSAWRDVFSASIGSLLPASEAA